LAQGVVLFSANMRDLTVFEHEFDASQRIYCLSRYLICSKLIFTIFRIH
jgi:hypothetical protein